MDHLIDEAISFLSQQKRDYLLLDDAVDLAQNMPLKKEEITPIAIKSEEPIPSAPKISIESAKEPAKVPEKKFERPKREPTQKPNFERTPLETHSTLGPDPSMLKLLQEVGIEVTSPPSDDLAKKVRFAWKDKRFIPAVPIFTIGQEHTPFLQNIQKAIESHFTSCRVIQVEKVEQSKKWEAFMDAPVELFVVPDYVISQNATLMKNMKVQKEKNARTLFGKPLLLLPDLTLYMRDPKLKRSLWNVLCQMLQK